MSDLSLPFALPGAHIYGTRRNAGRVNKGDTNVSWTSPRGSIITNVEQVDTYTLNRMYAAESAGQPIPKADAKTERAWKLGYLKPKR